VCQTIASCDRIALHVKTFWTLFNERRWNSSRNHLNPQFWDALHLALRKMHNLQVIAIGDPSCPSAWIFRQCQFQLQEAELRMDWDADLVRFLDTQSQLQSLRITNPRLSSTELDRLPPLALSQGALPSLRIFDGSLIAALEFVSSPITHLQVSLGQDGTEDVGHLLKQLAMFSRTLTSISVVDLPYSTSVGALDLFSLIFPHLRHIGIVPLPFSDRHKFHQILTRFSKVHTIELEVTGWVTRPAPAYQRIIAAEIRTYCPTVLFISFWFDYRRSLWSCDREDGRWHMTEVSDAQRHPLLESLWKRKYRK